jgi:hypothetical protein
MSILAQSRYKAHALCYVIVVADILLTVFETIYHDRGIECQVIEKLQSNCTGIRGERVTKRVVLDVVEKFHWDVELQRITGYIA